MLTLFEDLNDDIDILVCTKHVVELLIGRLAEDSLGACGGVEDVEAVDDIGQGNGAVTLRPLGKGLVVDKDDKLVGLVGLGLVR